MAETFNINERLTEKLKQMKKIFLHFIFITLSISSTFAQYTRLLHFAGISNGSNPFGSLISDGTFLYGMTTEGGASPCSNGCNGSGVIFKIKPDGTGYTKLHDFDSVNARNPRGSLFSDGTFLYGMTEQGGTNACFGGCGTIFKIKPDGTGYSNLFNFAGATNGGYPAGDLISDGIYLYGMTLQGGTYDYGTIFKIKPNGTGYTKLYDFDSINGNFPQGSFISDGTFLYGMTSASSGSGTIFKIKLNGTGYTVLHNFTGYYPYGDGNYPFGNLISDGTFLYGMTSGGGLNDNGVIFKIKPDGTGYDSLLSFNGANGSRPWSSFISDGNFLYGLTSQGGTGINCPSYSCGVLFKIKSDGTEYAKLYDFDGINGSNPNGTLFSDGIFLYGMTMYGGTNDDGVIFKNCVAHYTTSYDSIQDIFTLNVDSNITALATSYHWDFGDGTSSTLATPSHTYTANTVYNICMKIYLSSGDSCIYCHIMGKDSSGIITRDPGFTINVRNANSPADISQTFSNETNIEVFPNPTSGIFQIANTNYQISNIEVYNLLGELVHQHRGAFSNLQINLANQPNGIYFLNIKTKQGTISKKLIINK